MKTDSLRLQQCTPKFFLINLKSALSLFLLLFVINVFANNVRVDAPPRLSINGDTVDITFNLSWENSWRDDFNWDAVWLFVKYTTPQSTDAWKHVKLTTVTAMPAGFIADPGMLSASECGGVFIMRDKVGNGHIHSVPVTLKALRKNMDGITDAQIENEEIFVLVSAIEMVYIPYGGYYLGDGTCSDRLGDAEGKTVLLDSEDAISGTTVTKLYTVNGNVVGSALTVSANYPKGYRGFYCMKYELSQEQYVSFLNSLSRAQQKNRIGNDLDLLKEGEYAFGDLAEPSYRNGICILSNEANAPAIFAHNLTQDEYYNNHDDGQYVPCNYLTPADMLAYCDWASLRPMSELEYEKMCRRPYPQTAVEGEYAWNGTALNKISGVGDMENLGQECELPKLQSYNVNYGNVDFAPVRCGSFGGSGSGQAQSGSTFWGLMEMSGNLSELCYSVGAVGFNAANVYLSHGDGILNTDGSANVLSTYWPIATTATNFTLRGGSFASDRERLRISDRTVSSVDNTRNPEVSFRGVRTIGDVAGFTGGEISAPEYGCRSGSDIVNVTEAEYQDLAISYEWYVQLPGSTVYQILTGEVGANLLYHFENGGAATATYKLKRKAVCPIGVAYSNEVSVKVLPHPFASTSQSFNAGSAVKVVHRWGTISGVTWEVKDALWAQISTANNVVTLSGGFTDISFVLSGNHSACPLDIFDVTVEVGSDFVYKGAIDSVTLIPGRYKVECWGAQGGSGKENGKISDNGAYGGYGYGEIVLSGSLTLYIYIGGKGSYGSGRYGGAGGWNGGATGGSDTDDDPGGGGGGATDVRLVKGDLYSRIMVAGGGSGGAWNFARNGTGGGLKGVGSYGLDGTQIGGYAFGKGGVGITVGTGKVGGGGGGGGYYGGKGGIMTSNGTQGGGGSGFVSGMTGCNAVTATGTHTGSPVHYSGYQFINAGMQNGVRAGNGLVRITRLN